MWKEFKEFAMRGNVIDMAVGITVGAAFGTIAKSLVADIIMPPIGLLLGNVDFSNLFVVIKDSASAAGAYATLADAQNAGAVVISYGVFITNLVSFLIIAFAIFLVVKGINRLQRQPEPVPAVSSTKECPYCKSKIAINAIRCPHCTSELEKV